MPLKHNLFPPVFEKLYNYLSIQKVYVQGFAKMFFLFKKRVNPVTPRSYIEMTIPQITTASTIQISYIIKKLRTNQYNVRPSWIKQKIIIL